MTTNRLVYLFIVAASLSYAQTITLTSTDSRCSGSPLTCTFVGIENISPTSIAGGTAMQPNDYGLPITATLSGGGTWTIGAENQSTCDATLFAWWAPTVPPTSPSNISSISASGKVYFSPNGGIAGKCAPGTYTHTITLTNGSATYTFTAVQIVIYRQAAPVYLNGCGVSDASLSGGPQGNCPGGQTQQAPSGGTFISDLNKLPCSDCRPGGTFNMPAPGGTFRDQFGNLNRVITPVGFAAAGDAEKANQSVNNLWIIANSLGSATYGTGAWFIFPSTGSATPSWSFNGLDLCNGTFMWSSTTDTDIYCSVGAAAYSGGDTVFKHIVLAGSPPYPTPGTGYTSTTVYTMPYATYGRLFDTNMSHQDMNKLNWVAGSTFFDFQGQVSTSGTALSWVSGQVFDTNKFLDQWIFINGSSYIIDSCADNHHCTLHTSAGVQINQTGNMAIPWKVCAFNLVTMTSLGAGYTPTCGDLTAMARPRANYYSGLPTYIAHDVDPDNGLIYLTYTAWPSNINGSFDPASPTSITLTLPWTLDSATGGSGWQFGQCTPALSGTPGAMASFNQGGYCVYATHATGFSAGDGSQWFLNGTGASFGTFKFNAVGSVMRPYAYNGGAGNFATPMWTQFQGGEYSGSRKSPYMLASTGNIVFPKSWSVTNCTNANPMVVTVSTGSPTGINNTTHNKVLIGGVLGNTACNGSQTVASVSGANSEIWTLSAAGSGAYTASTGDATEDVVNAGTAAGDADQMYLCRDLCQEVRRFGHTRSVGYNDRCTSGYYAVTRATLSMDATNAVYTTNNGIPGCSEQIVMVTTGVDNGIGMTSNKFDSTHSVTAIDVTATTASLHYSTPDTGSAIIEIGQTLRLVDTPGNGSSADPTFLRATDSSGANPRATTFSGLTPGARYYYRIVANQKWMAWGAFTLAAANAGGGTVVEKATVTNAVIH